MIFLATLLMLIIALTIVWALSVRLRDVSIVDICWGPAFAAVAWMTCALNGVFQSRPLLLATLVTMWGVRLAVHIYARNHGAGEDARYVAIRQRYGSPFWWQSLFIVFWLQGALAWFIALPIIVTGSRTGPPLWTINDVAGLALFLCGFAFEAIGDEQLRRFKANPANKGRVLDRGLWRYTRHPNYFGDALLWWGLFVIATASPVVALTALSPALMTFLLLRVSGVALLERDLKTRKPDYREYIDRTSSFVPWPPTERSPKP